ncbi:MAG: hypothetical protein AAF685_10020 [Cyanobacteria bacterium P01_C01_bin.89]
MGWFGKKKDEDGNEIQLSPRELAEKQFKNALGAIYAVAILNAVIGAALVIFQVELPGFDNFGVLAVIEGAIFGVLGFWVQKKRSAIGLGLALGLYIFGSLSFIVASVDAGRPPTSGIAIRVALIYFMFQGFGAIKQLKSAKVEDESAVDSPEADNP